MKSIVSDPNLVAYCGLYCGACRAYLRGRCPGCHDNEKATWCKIRTCCMEEDLTTCADYSQFSRPDDCKKFNNLVAKFFAFFFRSDRTACIEQIRTQGVEAHAEEMSKREAVTLKK